MPLFLNTELYNPSAAIDQVVADGNSVVLFDVFSSDYATIVANEIYTYAPTITKVADAGGFKANVAAMTNQTEPTNTGVVNQYAILDTVNSKVLAIGESSGVTITAGSPFNVPVFAVHMPAVIVTP